MSAFCIAFSTQVAAIERISLACCSAFVVAPGATTAWGCLLMAAMCDKVGSGLSILARNRRPDTVKDALERRVRRLRADLFRPISNIDSNACDVLAA